MNFLDRMNQAIAYIEEHLDDDVDYRQVARLACCSICQFREIFSYLTGISISEYVRKRRMTLAALELQSGGEKVIDVSLKYGYASPEAFARAFRELHGISPREASTPSASFKMALPVSFQISVKGDTEMDYRIEKKGVIRGVGVTKNFGTVTANKEAENWTEVTPDIYKFWEDFLDRGANIEIRDFYRLYRPPFWQMGVTHSLANGDTVISIGAEDAGGEYPDLQKFEMPARTWAVFPAKGDLDSKSHPIQEVRVKVFAEWLPSSGYEIESDYEIEVYGPGDTHSDGYLCELWIPVHKK
ncbi:MAG: AraC family transcriptional regulator [Clostridiales bacterium]|nr:MAG: AraC family transcriptional regulator [Clostridiales bacterium]